MSILIFDSGIGGLTVLREARVLMPEKKYVYVADNAAFPYGNWQEKPLLDHMVKLFGELIEAYSPELIVIACNTASTLAIAELRKIYPEQKFVGTVPAIKPAAERSRSGLVSVLATPGTVERQYTQDLIEEYASKCEVNLVGSTGLAKHCEIYMRGGLVDEEAVRQEISPCFVENDGRRTDIIVLACTHYPFLVNRLRKVAPWPVDWIDTSEAIARRAMSITNTNHSEELAKEDKIHFTKGRPDPLTEKLLKGFGLTL